MRILYLFSFYVLFFVIHGRATHIIGGEITAKRIANNSLTYKITFTGYRDQDSSIPLGGAGLLKLGDGTELMGPFQTTIEDTGNGIDKVSFTITHTYSESARRGYLISYEEQFRNSNIININDGDSDGTTFYVETLLIIAPFYGINSSPILTVPPVDFAAIGTTFINNPGAFDPDGDSLAYKLTDVKSSRNVRVSNYKELVDPSFYTSFDQGNESQDGPPTLTLNPVTGDLIWDAPGDITNQVGGVSCPEKAEYSVAFIVEEWRNVFGTWRLMGYVERDMKIIVCSTDNEPPVIEAPEPVCVEAGTIINEPISGADPDGDPIAFYAYGGPFEVGQGATFSSDGPESSTFIWNTECGHIAKKPYTAYFKVTDSPEEGPNQSTVANWEIKVIGPPVTGVQTLNLDNGTIQISWDAYICDNADSIQIWRREGSYELDECDFEMLTEVGYQMVGKTGVNSTAFIDDNNGTGFDENASPHYQLVAEFSSVGYGDGLKGPLSSIKSTQDPVVKIYPNPTSDGIRISSLNEIKFFKVYSLAGNELFTQNTQGMTEFTGLNEILSSGIYYIQFFSTNERLVDSQRLIIVD